MDISSQKIEEYIGDILTLESFSSEFKADEVFCCIGTTNSKTPDKELYRKIDYGIPVAAGKLCKANDIDTLIIISAMGANPKSNIFYNRLKGEMEESVFKIGVPRTYILQPSLISGRREEWRFGEWLAKQLFNIFNVLLIGPLKKYRSIHPNEIAKCMIRLSNTDKKSGIIASDEIKRIAKGD
ncbi:nucleoside-diphosphate sugar epimerase [Maribacter litopenaei]|uniref:nucleoside-diphosphate sugar epimerase n=1 Tax=Maribacter litopenaei TaxID=2976127 RepID=UPI0030844CD8